MHTVSAEKSSVYACSTQPVR